VKGLPAVPPGSDVPGPDGVVMESGAAAMLTTNVCEAVAPLESVTVTFTLKLPRVVGVPLTVVPESETPGGKPLGENEYGGAPPLALTLPE